MRRLVLVLATTGVLAVPASAATVDPSRLVLQQRDVPVRYLFDKDNSGTVRKFSRAVVDKDARRLVVRYGLRSASFARYTNDDPPHWKYVDSSAFVFSRARGAKSYLAWFDQSVRKSGEGGARERRNALDLGAEGWIYSSRSPATGTTAVWRHGRVVATVGCRQMTGHRALTLALARRQQLRIAAELR
jgi:hypothetical protein